MHVFFLITLISYFNKKECAINGMPFLINARIMQKGYAMGYLLFVRQSKIDKKWWISKIYEGESIRYICFCIAKWLYNFPYKTTKESIVEHIKQWRGKLCMYLLWLTPSPFYIFCIFLTWPLPSPSFPVHALCL